MWYTMKVEHVQREAGERIGPEGSHPSFRFRCLFCEERTRGFFTMNAKATGEQTVVIVGAGLAGGNAAVTLRAAQDHRDPGLDGGAEGHVACLGGR